MITDTKNSHITRSKKPFNYDSKKFNKKMDKMMSGGRRKSLMDVFFPKRRGFWWKGTHNGVFGPGGHTRWEFKSGNLAVVIAIISLILIIGYIVLNLFL